MAKKRRGSKAKSKANAKTRPVAATSAEEAEPLDQSNLDLLNQIRQSSLHKTSNKKAKKQQRKVQQSSDEEESDVEVDAAVAAPSSMNKRMPVNNVSALTEKLVDVKSELDFEETLVVVDKGQLDVDDIEDDLNREVEFYNQALRSVKAGRVLLDACKTEYNRPIDYFAEMVKSDEHMGRVKQHLLHEQHKMEAFEKRKKQKEFKKFAKQLNAQKQKEKGEKKRQLMKVAEEFKTKGKGKEIEKFKKRPEKSAKRKAADRKFGFGGKKKGKR